MLHIAHFSVDGMMCQNSCGSTVQNSLRSAPDVLHASASFTNASAFVILPFAPTATTISALLEAIDMVGFDATLHITSPLQCHMLSIQGMMCQNSCGTTCTNALLAERGVVVALATFVTSSAIVFSEQSDPLHSDAPTAVTAATAATAATAVTAATADDLAEAVEDVGFEAVVTSTTTVPAQSSKADQLLSLLRDAEEKKTTVSTVHRQIETKGETSVTQSSITPSSPRHNNLSDTKGLCKMFFNVGGMSCASCSSSIERNGKCFLGSWYLGTYN